VHKYGVQDTLNGSGEGDAMDTESLEKRNMLRVLIALARCTCVKGWDELEIGRCQEIMKGIGRVTHLGLSLT
jgi:hypothetical protein